jgi:aspartyl-tRNA(Asn)/glutamyl-tRNA(Gln) amidotransferase subunit C
VPQKLSLADVAHVADLARLELSAEELDAMTRDLSAILRFAATVQQVDTSLPESEAVPAASPLREDELVPGLSTADATRGAPELADGATLFRVPKVR